MFNSLLNIIPSVLDKVIPDPKLKAEAKIKLLELQQQGQFKDTELALSAIIAESQSKDKWTSRARPTFLYVVYILILSSVPFSILFAVNPESAKDVAEGFGMWLKAIPNELYTLMGVGYLGYTGARTFDKRKKQ